MINDFFINAKTNVINFNRFVILIINVYNHFNFNFLTLFFSFEIFSMIDEKFEFKMLRQLSCKYQNVHV